MSSRSNLEHSGTARVHATDLVRRARDNKRVARELDHLNLHDLADDLREFADSQLRMARMWLPRRRNRYLGGPWNLRPVAKGRPSKPALRGKWN